MKLERRIPNLRSQLSNRAANSFGEKQVARFAAEWSVRVATLNDAQMEALDRAAALLADPATRPEEVARGLERLGRFRVERGDIAGGRQLLEEAARIFGRLGMKAGDRVKKVVEELG